jgi:hypothetical protein
MDQAVISLSHLLRVSLPHDRILCTQWPCVVISFRLQMIVLVLKEINSERKVVRLVVVRKIDDEL